VQSGMNAAEDQHQAADGKQPDHHALALLAGAEQAFKEAGERDIGSCTAQR